MVTGTRGHRHGWAQAGTGGHRHRWAQEDVGTGPCLGWEGWGRVAEGQLREEMASEWRSGKVPNQDGGPGHLRDSSQVVNLRTTAASAHGPARRGSPTRSSTPKPSWHTCTLPARDSRAASPRLDLPRSRLLLSTQATLLGPRTGLLRLKPQRQPITNSALSKAPEPEDSGGNTPQATEGAPVPSGSCWL